MARIVAVLAYVFALISLPTILSWLAVDLDRSGAGKSLLFVGGVLGVFSWISWSVRLFRPRWISQYCTTIKSNFMLSLFTALNSLISFIVGTTFELNYIAY